jgi:hypothetical protein
LQKQNKMTKQLELKHLSAYLPYKPRVTLYSDIYNYDGLVTKMHHQYYFDFCQEKCNIKLHLRPISDLTKEIEHNGEMFVPIEKLDMSFLQFEYFHSQGIDLSEITYLDARKLHSWHFDTFGLIDAGLAVDINSIKE